MVKNIKFERVSPFQGKIEEVSPFQGGVEDPRCRISVYSMYSTLTPDWSNQL